MKYFALGIIAVLLVGCGGGSGVEKGTQKVSLAYGDLGKQYVQYKASTSVTYNLAGVIRQALRDITFSVRVDSIHPDGTIERRIKFDDFVMGEIAGNKLEPDPNAEKYKGEWLYLKLGPDGELVDWKGLEGIHGYTVADQNLKDDIVQTMVQFFQPLYKEEVGVGSKWQAVIEIPIRRRGGEIKQKVTVDYLVEGFGKKAGRPCVKIATKAHVDGEGEGEMAGGKKFWISTTGDGNGEIWYDYVNGLPVESSGTATITSDFSYERAGKEDVKTQTATIDVEEKIKLIE